jgi:phosphoenolpyruvate-protein phosphotransferase (PTS system enzyme I)
MQRLSGTGVSPGVACGRAVILIQRLHVLRYQVLPERVEGELLRLEESRVRTREQLVDIRARVGQRRGSELAALFDAQLLMLEDPMLVPAAAELVRAERVNAGWAVQQVFQEFSAVFDEASDPYLRERKGDVADLVGRLRMNLGRGAAAPRELLSEVEDSSVLIADELTPSLAAQVDWTKVRGFATDAGSRTYHTAILARSLDVPAIVGLHDASRLIQPGQLVMIDADANEVIVDPDPETVARVRRSGEDRRPAGGGDAARRTPAATADGTRIRLEANVEFPNELAAARYAGAEGIGLYRSEFLLTAGGGVPAEDQQYEIYRGMLDEMGASRVTVRTFDVNEDQLDGRGRMNRQGLRGLRLSLARPEVFQTQIRALLRAARHGTLRILFPFVSGVDELREARRLVRQVVADLEQREPGRGVPPVPIGAMIEIPAAAYTADLLAREVDFFTIGTNDLIQYCLAVDRADERVSRLYEPLHPAVLRLIVMVVRAATRRRIPVSLCGEMASDPALLTLLVGLGLRDFSMTPAAIGVAKQMLAEARSEDLRALARRVLRLSTVDEIQQELLGEPLKEGL